MPDSIHDVLIIGAGPAGLICAAEAAARGLSVLIVEGQDLPGAKFCMAGMGAGAVSNDKLSIEAFQGKHARFASDALAAFDPETLRQWFAARGVTLADAPYYGLVTSPEGGPAIMQALVDAAESAGTELLTGVRVTHLKRTGQGFRASAHGRTFDARHAVLATGAQNYPQLGGGEEGGRMAANFGHAVAPALPGQVGLRVEEGWVRELPGLWMDVRAALHQGRRVLAESTGSMLFTQSGLVGEAIYNVSHAAEPALQQGEVELAINFFPEQPTEEVAQWLFRVLGERTRERAADALDLIVPRALGRIFLDHQKTKGNERVMQLDERQRDGLLREMIDTRLKVTGTLGLIAAESATGGVSVRDVDPRSMQSRKCPGLFVIGELLDLHAPWGGFRQHFALATGYLCGRSIAQ